MGTPRQWFTWTISRKAAASRLGWIDERLMHALNSKSSAASLIKPKELVLSHDSVLIATSIGLHTSPFRSLRHQILRDDAYAHYGLNGIFKISL